MLVVSLKDQNISKAMLCKVAKTTKLRFTLWYQTPEQHAISPLLCGPSAEKNILVCTSWQSSADGYIEIDLIPYVVVRISILCGPMLPAATGLITSAVRWISSARRNPTLSCTELIFFGHHIGYDKRSLFTLVEPSAVVSSQ